MPSGVASALNLFSCRVQYTVMTENTLEITEYGTFDAFATTWDGSETDTRLVWQLLGQLADDELLIELPDWLAEEKVGFVDGATPTAFVGRIERETDKAIRVTDAAAARSLMKLAHRIHELEQNEDDPDRDEWLDRQLQKHRRAFEEREDVITLQDEWLPKSQLRHVIRRA